MRYLLISLIAVVCAGTVVLIIFGWSMAKPAKVTVSNPTNIDGIAFSTSNGSILISEQLAHSDLAINRPVLASTIVISLEFIPVRINYLALGIRQGEFWLDYDPIVIFEGNSHNEIVNFNASIPVTAALQDRDQTLDLMLIASPDALKQPDLGVDDKTWWEIKSINISIRNELPSMSDLRNYVGSIVRRERAK
jgi:hypothetical protein